MATKTYTSSRTNPIAFLREAWQLYRMKNQDIPGQASGLITYMRDFEQTVQQAIGIRLENLRILDIGPGQVPREIIYLGLRNEVVAIDLDVIPERFTPTAYLTMLKQNGPARTVKTLARKMLGIDARFSKELKKQMGVTTLPHVSYQQMDGTEMTFADASFDLIYSFSVFEHLSNAARAIAETVRVLKSGGGCYISLHLYSSDSGCHDVRIFANARADLPCWSHLRPQYAARVQPNAYLNEIRLAEWKRLFEEWMPGVQFALDTHGPEIAQRLGMELENVRKTGELADYTDEELMSVNLIAIWRKP